MISFTNPLRDNTSVNSFTTTLIDKGTTDGITSVSAGSTIPASSTFSSTVTCTLPNTKCDGLYRIRVSGTGQVETDGFWFSTVGFLNLKGPASSYFILVTNSTVGTTLTFTFRFSNNTAAPIILPAITLEAHGRLYSYPWTT